MGHCVHLQLAQVDKGDALIAISSLTITANKQTTIAEQHRGTYERAAKAAGVALCAIQAQLPRGEWNRWVRDHYHYSKTTANTYMRFARGPTTPEAIRRHPIAFHRQAEALRKTGWAYSEIAQELGVSSFAIRSWLDPEAARRRDVVHTTQRREARALRRRRGEEEAQRRARAAGGNLLKARASLVTACEALGALAGRETDADLCLEYTKARTFAQRAIHAVDRVSAERLLVR